MLPSIVAVSLTRMRTFASSCPFTSPPTTISSATMLALMRPPAAIVTGWPSTAMDPSTLPAIVSGSRAVTCPLIRIAGPINAVALMGAPFQLLVGPHPHSPLGAAPVRRGPRVRPHQTGEHTGAKQRAKDVPNPVGESPHGITRECAFPGTP